MVVFVRKLFGPVDTLLTSRVFKTFMFVGCGALGYYLYSKRIRSRDVMDLSTSSGISLVPQSDASNRSEISSDNIYSTISSLDVSFLPTSVDLESFFNVSFETSDKVQIIDKQKIDDDQIREVEIAECQLNSKNIETQQEIEANKAVFVVRESHPGPSSKPDFDESGEDMIIPLGFFDIVTAELTSEECDDEESSSSIVPEPYDSDDFVRSDESSDDRQDLGDTLSDCEFLPSDSVVDDATSDDVTSDFSDESILVI